jgi:CubicO group peptidase (beta-lactamase class C family)
MTHVDRLMKDAVISGVFPGGVLLVSLEGATVFFEAYGFANLFTGRQMTKETVFDLASLTKPLATTLAVMHLLQNSRLSLKQRLGSILPALKNTDKKEIQIEHLLYHNSGLPDYRPYYKWLSKIESHRKQEALRELLAIEPLIHVPGGQILYSDIGFMILCWVIEEISGCRLDRFVAENIYRPLGLDNLFFVDIDGKPSRKTFAATERCPWRGILLEGMVHDDNAYAVGGIEGHAGLFGSAGNLLSLLSELMTAFHGNLSTGVFDVDLVQRFLKRSEPEGRTLGFDTPSSIDPSCGRYFSEKTVGHLGFTGTSFWMDLHSKIIVVLLTNRIHPSRNNNRIKAFRPKLHDAVMENILDRRYFQRGNDRAIKKPD